MTNTKDIGVAYVCLDFIKFKGEVPTYISLGTVGFSLRRDVCYRKRYKRHDNSPSSLRSFSALHCNAASVLENVFDFQDNTPL